MNLQFVDPLVQAWNRMVQDLFKPFRAGRWFAVGFAAWLVSLGGGGGGGGNFNIPTNRGGKYTEAQSRIIEQVKEFFSGPAGVSLLIGFGLGLLLLIVLFLWLGSRAQFVFLDQVTGRHWRIADPWSRYSVQGNSLFLWRIGFALVMIAVIAILLGPGIAYLATHESGSLDPIAILVVLWTVLVLLAVCIPAAYVHCFLNAFVVPLMYREGRRTNDAWRRFLPLLRAHKGAFLLYGLFVLALAIGIAVVLFVFSCATCCIAFCLLALPYLGTVFSLPIPYTFRCLGPSFLAQFGPEWWAWPDAVAPAAPSPEPPLAPA